MRFDLQPFIGNEEMVNVPILSTLIVDSMREDGTVEMYTKEAFSAEDFGLLKIIDDLVEYYGWDSKNILLESTNMKEMKTITSCSVNYLRYYNGNQLNNLYNITEEKLDRLAARIHPWNGEYDFGMFISRLSVARLHALERLRSFEFKHRGISSMLQTPSDPGVNDAIMLQYLKESNLRWSDIENLQSYSDIEAIVPDPPLTEQIFRWKEVYRKIAIEVICETNETYNGLSISSVKTHRCMLHKRPFLLIGSPGSLRALTHPVESGYFPDWYHWEGQYKFFEDVIPLHYDNLQGKERVDAVFDILDDLIRTGKINTILDDCRDDIESNYNMVRSIILGEKNNG